MSWFINLSLLHRNQRYRYLYIGQFVSFFGTMMTSVTLPYQIYHMTRSTLMVGLLSFAQLVPLIFTALLGGVLADRHHRRTLLLIAECFMAIGCLLLALNASVTTPSIWVIFLVSASMSALNGLHRPALDSMTQQLVEKKDFYLVSALATFKFSMSMIAGPAIAGLIISHFGIVITFLVDFSTFFVSLGALLLITAIPKPHRVRDESTWASLMQGFYYAKSKQALLGTYFVDFIAMIFGMPMALFPAIADKHGGVKVLGMLYAAPAVGALIISLFSAWTQRVIYHGLAVAVAAMLWGVAIIFFGLSTNLWVALFFLALAGAFDAVSSIFRQVIWNDTVLNEYRGRLSGIEMLSYLSGPKLGDTEAGMVAAAFGVTASVVSGGVLCVIGVAICCYFLPKFMYYKVIY